nr:InlB B-repeat-containing protein [Clostridiales bacterium]
MKNIRKVLSLLLTAALLCATALSCPVTAVAADYGSTVTEIAAFHSETTVTQQIEMVPDEGNEDDLLIINGNEGGKDTPLVLNNSKGIKKSDIQKAQATAAPEDVITQNDANTATNDGSLRGTKAGEQQPNKAGTRYILTTNMGSDAARWEENLLFLSTEDPTANYQRYFVDTCGKVTVSRLDTDNDYSAAISVDSANKYSTYSELYAYFVQGKSYTLSATVNKANATLHLSYISGGLVDQAPSQSSYWTDQSTAANQTITKTFTAGNTGYYRLAFRMQDSSGPSATFTNIKVVPDDNAVQSKFGIYSTKSRKLVVPTRTGYSFNGWSKSGTATVGSSTTNPVTISSVGSDVTLTAQWTAKVYRIVLNNQSATTSGTTDAYYQYETTQSYNNTTYYYYTNADCDPATHGLSGGYKITKPTKTGYTFGGYYTGTNGSGTQYVTESGGFTNNIYKKIPSPGDTWTLYAKWTPNIYHVVFNNQGATSAGTTEIWYKYYQSSPYYYYTDSTCTTGLPNYKITTPQKIGYTFGGYNTEANGSGTQYVNASGTCIGNMYQTTGDKELYAQWTAITYNINYDLGTNGAWPSNSSHPSTAVFGSGGNFQVSYPTRTGYTFTGWKLSGSDANFGSDPTKNAIYAYMGSVPITSADQLIIKNANFQSTYFQNLSSVNGATVTLTAQWTSNTCIVTFDKQSGTGGTASVTATLGSAMPSATMPTRTGYTFGGYYDGTNGSGTQYYTAAGASARNWDKTSDTILYAKWVSITYNIQFDPNAGTWNDTTSITNVQNVPFGHGAYEGYSYGNGYPTRVGYTFTGWKLTYVNNSTPNYSTSSTHTESQSTACYYKGSSHVNIVDQNTLIMPPAAGAPAGLVLCNLCVNQNDTAKLTATWTPNIYQVTLNNQGATTAGTTAYWYRYETHDGSIYYYEDSSCTTPLNTNGTTITVPTKTGYTFGGYWTNSDGTGTQYVDASGALCNNIYRSVADNSTLYAKWTAITYNIQFVPNGGTMSGSTNVTDTFGSTNGYNIALSDYIPTRAGYTFIGWKLSYASGSTENFSTSTSVSSGASTAHYGVYGNSNRTGITRDSLLVPTTGQNTVMSLRNLCINNNDTAILTAQWTANTYTVTLDKRSGTGGTGSVTATYGSAMPVATMPTRTGYTFGGYYDATNGGGTQYYTAAGASARTWNKTSDTTLYAYWTPNIYQVTLDNQSATTPGTTAYWYRYETSTPYYYYEDSSCTTPLNTNGTHIVLPTKTGYTFGGYWTNSDGTGTQYVDASGALCNNIYRSVAGNSTLYAKWTPNIYKVTLNNQGATTAGTTQVWYQFNTTQSSGGTTYYYYTNSNCNVSYGLSGGCYI